MKKTLILLLSFLTFQAIQAQAPWQWAKRGGSTNAIGGSSNNYNNVIQMATDPHDNVYLLCRAGAGSLQVDGNSLTGYAAVGVANNIDIVLASFSPTGGFRWAKVIGGSNSDYGHSLKLDANGGVYLTGRVSRSPSANNAVHFDSDTVLPMPTGSNNNRQTMFLAKYDTSGSFQWLRMPEPDTVSSAGRSTSLRIDVTPGGDIKWFCLLKPGLFQWPVNNIITNEGAYVLMYDSNGNMQGYTQLSMQAGSGFAFSGGWNKEKFAYDPALDRYYVGGINENIEPLIIGGDTIKDRMYLAAFDNQGQVVWKLEGNNDINSQPLFGNNNINDLKLNSGDIYLTGCAYKGVEFGGVTLSYPSTTGCSPFVMKISSTGNLVWAKIANGRAISPSNSIVVQNNELAISGYSGRLFWQGPNDLDTLHVPQGAGYDAFLARFDIQTGDLKGMTAGQSPQNGGAYGHSIAADSEGAYYMGGNYDLQVYLGSDTLFLIGSQRSFFVAKYFCDSISPAFTAQPNGTAMDFTYTGSPADSILWRFGDGNRAFGDSASHTYAQPGYYEVCVTAISPCAKITHCDTVAFGNIGIGENRAFDGLKVYPNPTSGLLHLQNLTSGSSLTLYATNGQMVQHLKLSRENETLDLTSLPQGLYFLKIKSEGGEVRVVKILKQP